MNIIILLPEDKIRENLYKLNDYRAEHLLNILKVEKSSIIQTGLLNGNKGKSEIQEIINKEIYIDFIPDLIEENKKYEIDLICAMPRPQTLKKILVLSGTFEIRSLTLIKSNRVEKSYFQTPLLDETKINHYLIEGLMQGKFTRLPKVKIFNKFKKFWDDEFNNNLYPEFSKSIKLLAHPETDSTVLEHFTNINQNYIILIGPEGGWVPFEIDYIKSKNFIPINLGKPILRVENAVNAVLSQFELCKIKNKK